MRPVASRQWKGHEKVPGWIETSLTFIDSLHARCDNVGLSDRNARARLNSPVNFNLIIMFTIESYTGHIYMFFFCGTSPIFYVKARVGFSLPPKEISISDYLDLIEVAEEHETCISWYMGKLPLHTDVPEMFDDICNAPNSPWRCLGGIGGFFLVKWRSCFFIMFFFCNPRWQSHDGSIYGIYDNIYHQYIPNVSIYHTWILWQWTTEPLFDLFVSRWFMYKIV